MSGQPRQSRRLRKELAANPWLGTVRHIEAFRPWGVLIGIATISVTAPVVITVIRVWFGDALAVVFRDVLASYAFDAAILVIEVFCLMAAPFVLWSARRRLVVCDHGVLLGGIRPVVAIPWVSMDLESLTPVARFSRIARELYGWESNLVPNGSSQPWGSHGIVFRVELDPHGELRALLSGRDELDPYGELRELLAGPQRKEEGLQATVFFFGTTSDPYHLLCQIASAATDHGIEAARRLPGLNEEPVVLTGRKSDAIRQLPRVMSDPHSPA